MSAATAHPRRISGIDGQDLKAAFIGATAFLEQQVAAINALNVFPVPDGDTGTNMALTMRATVGAVAESPEHHAGQVAQKMAQGALMGARGNSGVILSQIVRGFAKAIADTSSLDAQRLAQALQGATRTAYQGVTKPVEGTMLTVIRKAAEAAEQVANAGGDCDAVLAAAVEAARVAVADTPNLLAVLRDAGVVDSGGQGVWVLLDGFLRTLRGEAPPEMSDLESAPTAHAVFSGEQTYGYCTQFLIQGAALDIDEITRRLDPIGDSMVVVGDENLVRVHIHTFQPGDALNVGSALGILRNISIENMQVQHDVWKEERKATKPIIEGVSIVAVAAGSGFTKLFESLGVQEVVLGGHTMNPSAQDLVSAIERTPTKDVILLPNNDNILLTARQAAALTSRHVGVVPTTTLAQGVAAALSVKFGETFDGNLAAMTEAAQRVLTGEVTVAVRDAKVDGFTIAEGQAIGLINGRLAATGDTLEEAFWGMIAKMRPETAEVFTLYVGEDSSLAEGQRLADALTERYPEAAVEVMHGGQPHYRFVVSRE